MNENDKFLKVIEDAKKDLKDPWLMAIQRVKAHLPIKVEVYRCEKCKKSLPVLAYNGVYVRCKYCGHQVTLKWRH